MCCDVYTTGCICVLWCVYIPQGVYVCCGVYRYYRMYLCVVSVCCGGYMYHRVYQCVVVCVGTTG